MVAVLPLAVAVLAVVDVHVLTVAALTLVVDVHMLVAAGGSTLVGDMLTLLAAVHELAVHHCQGLQK